jgi:hypothetical protein
MKLLRAASIFVALVLWSSLALCLALAWRVGSACVVPARRCASALRRHFGLVVGARP